MPEPPRPPGPHRRDPVSILGIAIDPLTEQETIDLALDRALAGSGGWICSLNVDVLRQTTRDPGIRSHVLRADPLVADGMPILWAARVQGDLLPERVAGSTLLVSLCRAAAARGASVFLLGGNPGVADRAAQRLVELSPDLDVAGTHFPPFGFEAQATEIAAIHRAIRRTEPKIVFVGLPFGATVRTVATLRTEFPAICFVACGIGLSFAAGDVDRAPVWVQKLGMEWLHRLLQEPRRLARRYLVDDMPFLIRLMATASLTRLRREAGR